MSNLTRAITAAASGVGGTKTYVAFGHYNDSSSHNVSLYEFDGSTLTKLSSIQARSGDSASYAVSVAFNPDPATYGKILAVTTGAGYSIIDYSDDTSLTEVATGGSSAKNSRGIAYSASGANLFTSGSDGGYHYKYDQATNGTLSNETKSAYYGIGEYINAIAIAKTKDVGIVCFNKGSSAAVGAACFTPSDNSLDGTIVTKSEEVYFCDINAAGTSAYVVGKDHPTQQTSLSRLLVDSSNNLSQSTEVDAGNSVKGVRVNRSNGYVAVSGSYDSGDKSRLYYESLSQASTFGSDSNSQLAWSDDGEYLFAYTNATSLKAYSLSGVTLTLESTISSGIPNNFNYTRMDSITS